MKKECHFLENCVLLPIHDEVVRIIYSDIIFLNRTMGYTQIVISNGKTYLTKDALSVFEECLPDYFFRVNRAEIVNLFYCRHFRVVNEKGKIELSNGHVLPLSRRKKSYFKKRYSEHLMERCCGVF